MLRRNLIIWSKYRWNIEKWIFGKLMGLGFLNEEVEEFRFLMKPYSTMKFQVD